jgi:hypothetical protein
LVAVGRPTNLGLRTLLRLRQQENGFTLLYSDRDFDPFVRHLGLLSAMKIA